MSYPSDANHYLRLRSRISRRVKVVEELSPRDTDYIFDILVLRSALLHDLCGSTSATAECWERTILGLDTLDVGLYSLSWKMLRDCVTSPSFTSANRQQRIATLATFKRLRRDAIYRWIVNSACGLLEEGKSWFDLNQWITFDEKANLNSLNLEEDHFSEYLKFEDEYHCDFDSRYSYVVRNCATDMIGKFNLLNYPFRPRHSNGATSELERNVSDLWHKNRYFRYDSQLVVYLKWRLQSSEWRPWFFYPYKGLDRCCKLVAVPKSMRKNRLISKEPTMLQFLQQDIFRAMDEYFSSNPDCHVNLHDTTPSRMAALIGSSDGSYATIDLSSASDSVSVAIIQEILGDTSIFYPIMATRSEECLVQTSSGSISRRVKLKKFAPMGSAVCFPVECIVFASICEAAVRLVSGRRRSKPNDFYVYGDDIVIKAEYAEETVRILQSFGFTVNSSKTFGLDGQHGFREACGIECLDGEIVTPLRLGRGLTSFSSYDDFRHGGMSIAFCDFMNRCYEYSYPTLRRILNAWLNNHEWYRTCPRYSYLTNLDMPGPSVLVDPYTATQYRCYGKRAASIAALQYPEYLVTVATTRSVRERHDANNYYAWCLKRACNKLGDDPDIGTMPQPLSYEKPPMTQLKRKWVSIC